MSRHCVRAILALLLALASRSALAQAPTPRSGLLLGLHLEGEHASYRTVWIAPVEGRIRVVASGPDVIVPGRKGFWRACLVGGHEVADGQLLVRDSVVVRRATAGQRACTGAPAEPSDEVRKGVNCSGSTLHDILFAGSEAVGTIVFEESTCGAHPSGDAAVRVRTLDGRALDLEALLDGGRREALIESALRAGRLEFSDFGVFEGVGRSDSAYGPPARLALEHEWGIERAPGQWQVMATASCEPYVACGSMWRPFSVTGSRPPPALVGHDALSPSLASIREQRPGVKDAVSSPSGDIVLVLTRDSLLVFTPIAGRLGAPVLSRRVANARLVSAQWASGRVVPLWTKQLRTILRER